MGSTFHQESWEGEYDRHKKTAAKEATNFSTQNIKSHEISLQNNIGYSSWRIQERLRAIVCLAMSSSGDEIHLLRALKGLSSCMTVVNN